jgi:hypothetical protein
MPSSPGYKRDYAREYEMQKQRGESGTGSNSDNAKITLKGEHATFEETYDTARFKQLGYRLEKQEG